MIPSLITSIVFFQDYIDYKFYSFQNLNFLQMKYYYQFKAIISGSKAVGKKTILKQLDPQTDLKTIQLQDKI